MNRCLVCTETLKNNEQKYHKKCIERLFPDGKLPEFDIAMADIRKLAKVSVQSNITIPGVQRKLSLEIQRGLVETSKLTIVSFKGNFILKPPSQDYEELPENEHCTMLMAEKLGIETVPFGLIQFKTGELAYLTRRIDRTEAGGKLAMEDMCQLTNRPTELKYKGSHEQIAKVILKFSENPYLDIVRYFDQVLFTFLSGNADMHLKNFSLINDPKTGWKLAPAYDMVSTRLVIDEKRDPEELAIPAGGKKRKITKNVIASFGNNMGMNKKQISNRFENLYSSKTVVLECIQNSFLSPPLKEKYAELVQERFNRLFG